MYYVNYCGAQAYAEGLRVLRNANAGKCAPVSDAETTQLRNPELYQYDMNLTDITEVWRRSSVIGSWLRDRTADALLKDPQLEAFGGHAEQWRGVAK